jgi:hypothetical protein
LKSRALADFLCRQFKRANISQHSNIHYQDLPIDLEFKSFEFPRVSSGKGRFVIGLKKHFPARNTRIHAVTTISARHAKIDKHGNEATGTQVQ